MKIRFGTATKLAIAFLSLVLSAQWLGFNTARETLRELVDAREIDKVRTAGRVIDTLLARETQRLALIAKLLSAEDDVAASLLRPPAQRAYEVAAALAGPSGSARIDILDVVDAKGSIVYHAGAARHDEQHATFWGVAEALEGNGLLASSPQAAGVAIHAIEPLRVAGKVVGAIVVGSVLDAAFIKALSAEMGSDLALVSRAGKVIASQGDAAGRIDTGALTEAFFQKIPVYRQDAEARVTVAYLPVLIIDDAYVVVVRTDSAPAYRALEDNERRSLAFALLIIAASILAATLILRRLLGPLRRLRDRAAQTALEITGMPLPEAGSDEVGSAVHALEALTERLLARNRELAEAKQAADAANEAKTSFLSNMSHEIRTPLNGVLGMAELLQETPLDEHQARYCRTIVASGRTLRDLLGDVLDIAKIEAGHVSLETIDFDLETLARNAVDMFRELASARGTVLNYEFDPEANGRVTGDPTRLRQVLTNLLGNAVKFTERGQVMLTVTRLPPRPGDARRWLRFSIRDTGVGIAPDAVALLFRPFLQADTSTTRRFGGTGLGLAISKHLVELMGGKIAVESAPGRGATFWFDIPLAEAGTAAAPLAETNAALRRLPARVLVAEDNPVNQEVISALLTRIGTAVTLVDNGREAVEAVRSDRFDVVLMDCQMPVIDGYQAAAEIRASEQPGQRVPIIALTANAFAEDRQRCLDAGMDDYLAKPVGIADLAEMLRRWTRPAATVAGAVFVPAAAARRPAASAPIDEAVIATLVGGMGAAAVAKIMRLYITTAAEVRAALEAHGRERNLHGLSSTLHQLKSSTGSLGGTALAALAVEGERLSRAGDMRAIDLLPDTLVHLDRFCAALASHPHLD